MIQSIKENGIRAGVTLNAATALYRLEYILGELSQILIIMVSPGFAGQKVASTTLSKIEKLREIIKKKGLGVDIVADGDVSFANAPVVAKAGANILICGTSSVFDLQLGIKKGIIKLGEVLKDPVF